ncbi:uncharacterized protein [Coffea arabica]|uniref:RNase H type-1 domain-containing protein n=1 Tax=Coffea arabica TaxID=13443 RepID=A0ABM4UXW9_COFAR
MGVITEVNPVAKGEVTNDEMIGWDRGVVADLLRFLGRREDLSETSPQVIGQESAHTRKNSSSRVRGTHGPPGGDGFANGDRRMPSSVVYSTYRLSFKLSTPSGITAVSSGVCAARECYLTILQAASSSTVETKIEGKRSSILSVDYIDSQQSGKPQRLEIGDKVEEVSLDPSNPDQTIRIGTGLPGPLKGEMVNLLKEYQDIFAWTTEQVVGVFHHLMLHELNVDPRAKPVKTPGVVNVYRFHDLNKACSKDCYPLPRIDALVDSTIGYEVLCFLDAFKGYHQIGMSEEDQEKMAFFTDQGIYYYTIIPFDLNNTGMTYQRLINRVFKSQIGRNVETYVDDILLKSKHTSAFLFDVREVLRDTRMMLNPKKCVFDVISKKFLGYLVSRRGIEANPNKVKAIQKMSSPSSPRDVQRLTGKLAAMNRFLSQSAAKVLPFFKVLKKTDKFSWTEMCQQAFEQIKEYLHYLPTLTSQQAGEMLYLYLSAAEEVVSAVLIQDNGTQVSVYYVSRVLRGAETRYTQAEKLMLGFIHIALRLKPYFLTHPIRVLADFLTELTFPVSEEATSASAEPQQWTLYVDGSSNGSSNNDGSGVGLLLEDSHEETCSYALRFDFFASNNEAEYKAVIAGLQLARRLGARRISVYSDSQLVACQVLGEYEARKETMQRYLSKIYQLAAYFESFEIQKIPRSQNKRTDALFRLTTTSFSVVHKTILVEVLAEPDYLEDKV